MADEYFDSFKTPHFVGFSKKLDDSEECIDSFFEVDHENESKSQTKHKSSREERKSSVDAYFSPILNFDHSNVADSLEASLEETEHHNKLRKSMSVGNLILFSEEEHREEYTSDLEKVCEVVKDLDIETEKAQKKNTRNRISSARTNSNQSLYRKGSMDHLNKLAQPKHYMSLENIKKGNSDKYVSLAEAVNQFQNRTPVRFRSKPSLFRQNSQPLTRTVPESPALQTKARSRPGHRILSHEEREQLEFENQQKFRIKANPLNKKILKGPIKPTAPVEKKASTIPEPFKLTAPPPKKVMPSPKKYQFHAQPVPRSAEKSRKTQHCERKELTKPVTPLFMKNYRPPSHKKDVTATQKDISRHDGKPLTTTKPQPFSFYQRDKMIEKKRDELIQKISEEEKRAREFHARPLPKSLYKKNDSVRSDSGSSACSSRRYGSSENLSTQFKARPPKVLYKNPFVPAKSDKPCTKVKPFQLESEVRSYEREEFEREKKLKEEKLKFLKEQDEEERLRQEQEEIARLRKEAEYKAKPIRKYKELKIQPSNKVTEPISPKFHLRQKNNKENIPDNSS